MVEGLQEPLKPLCVVDLDGTLLTGNSMKQLMCWLPAELWRKGRILGAAEALLWIGLRAAKTISHRRMKWHLGKIAHRALSKDDWQRFASTALLPMLDPKVADHLNSMRQKGAIVCIASAAMEDYVEPIRIQLGYEHQLSTPHTDRFADYTEVRGCRKLETILKLSTDNSLVVCEFLTDHADDLPTAMEFPDITLLVNPQPSSLLRFNEAGITRRL